MPAAAVAYRVARRRSIREGEFIRPTRQVKAVCLQRTSRPVRLEAVQRFRTQRRRADPPEHGGGASGIRNAYLTGPLPGLMVDLV